MNAKSLATTVILSIYAAASFSAQAQEQYKNPVYKSECAEPTLIDDRGRSGYFYVYSAQTSGAYLPVYKSVDLLHWQFAGDGFKEGRPLWLSRGTVQAPDINYINGRYVLYYAINVKGGVVESGIGVAVADSPEGPFIDKGRLVDFKTMGTLNSIDPCFFSDEGRNYLYWGGTGGGIYGIELTADGLNIAEGAKKVQLGAQNLEAAYMYKRGEWYYLFASAGSENKGINSSYRLVVARSKSPLGPFIGPDGESFRKLNYKYTILAGSLDKSFVGPGHNAEIITDDNGDDWMLYHSYNIGTKYSRKALNLDQLHWTSKGWPYFETGEPSDVHAAPVFLKPVEKFEPDATFIIPVTEVRDVEKVKEKGFFKKAGEKISDFFTVRIPNTVSNIFHKDGKEPSDISGDENNSEPSNDDPILSTKKKTLLTPAEKSPEKDMNAITATTETIRTDAVVIPASANGVTAETTASETATSAKSATIANDSAETSTVTQGKTSKNAKSLRSLFSSDKSSYRAVPDNSAAYVPAEEPKKAEVEPAKEFGRKQKESRQLAGGYTEQRAIAPDELEMFKKLTSSSAMVFSPISVATQVVAGLNYKFLCKCCDATGRTSTLCEIVIYRPLEGAPMVTSMEIVKE